jgi:hypothetical protein
MIDEVLGQGSRYEGFADATLFTPNQENAGMPVLGHFWLHSTYPWF